MNAGQPLTRAKARQGMTVRVTWVDGTSTTGTLIGWGVKQFKLYVTVGGVTRPCTYDAQDVAGVYRAG